MSKAFSNLPSHQKEKQRAYEHPLSNARTVSHNGDSTKIRPVHYNTPTKPRYPDQVGKNDTTERGKLPNDLPQPTLNNEEEPPPPPEITSASIMATTRLQNTLSDLLDAINYYEEFDRICRDTPAWSYFVGQQTRDIRSSLRCIRQAAAYILYLRDGGQGTLERGKLEGLVKEVFAIEKEAKTEWKDISAKYWPKEGEDERKAEGEGGDQEKKAEEEKARLREEHGRAYRRFIGETYVRKMKSCLGGLQAAGSEIEVMKRELRMGWEELGKMNVQELEEMEETY